MFKRLAYLAYVFVTAPYSLCQPRRGDREPQTYMRGQPLSSHASLISWLLEQVLTYIDNLAREGTVFPRLDIVWDIVLVDRCLLGELTHSSCAGN